MARFAGWLVLGLLGCCGCNSAVQERVRDYHQDGIAQFSQGNYRQAAESFEAALNLQPGDPGLTYNLARSFDLAGQAERAQYFYKTGLGREPNNPLFRHGLASSLVRGGKPDEAEKMVQDWLAREPNLADAYAEDGWLWRQQGNLPRAQARLQQALEIDPHNPRALVELALLYESLQRPDRALVLYERILWIDPRQRDIEARIRQLQGQGVDRPHPD